MSMSTLSNWKIFSNPTRLKIIETLKKEPLTTGELCKQFSLSRFGVMKHLKILEQAGIVRVERVGRYRWNYLVDEKLYELQQELRQQSHDKPQPFSLETTVFHPQIHQSYIYPVESSQLFEIFTEKIDAWWSDTSKNEYPMVVFENRLGGHFYHYYDEDKNGILFGVVDQYKKGELIGFAGGMGNDFTYSFVRFRFESIDTNQSQLNISHRFMGETEMHALYAFEQSWKELLETRLSIYVQGKRNR